MRTPKLVVSAFTGASSLWLYLDDRLILKDSAQTTIELPSGSEFVMFWYVKGLPGSTYSISISSPREAEYQLTKTLLASGKDHGSFHFSVTGVAVPEESNAMLL